MVKKMSIRFFVLLFVITMTMVGCRQKEVEDVEKKVEEDYVAVETKVSVKDTIANTRSFTGKVVANEEVMIIPKLAGTVESIHVSLGDEVKKDTILFALEQDDISKAVQQAEVAVRLAKKGIEQALNGMETATINYEITKENTQKALLDLERTKELYEQGAVSKSQLEQVELAASSAQSQLDTVQGQITQAKLGVQQAEEQLSQAEISYRQAIDNLENTIVKAPMDGVISSLNVKKGQIVGNGQVAVTMVDMDKVYVQIDVIEDIVNRLQVGQEVAVTIPAAFEEEVKSEVSYISPTADIGSKLYSVKVYIDNPNKKVRPGMSGEVQLNMDQIDSVIVIKRNAVLDKEDELFVFVVENDRAVKKPVKIGLDTGDYVEIKEGLEEGEQVIVKGQHYVEDGIKVKVVGGE
ncbi:MAG: efflux RND transporter periplasmic adaptor subunit [Epulopiscium sp.]|nr:efflux RND transporter periplasmic adaptor subunit [Candidatus Epulonipiscium sp.]